jgi:hypothetical protein
VRYDTHTHTHIYIYIYMTLGGKGLSRCLGQPNIVHFLTRADHKTTAKKCLTNMALFLTCLLIKNLFYRLKSRKVYLVTVKWNREVRGLTNNKKWDINYMPSRAWCFKFRER